MAIQGPKTPIQTNVNPINTTQTGQRQPASAPGVSQQPPARDARNDAANLNRIAPQQGAFRVGIAGRNIGGTSEAERKLPGGSVSAAYGRAEEYGDLADAAAARVAANHPEIFGA